jgi:hypothetical protein
MARPVELVRSAPVEPVAVLMTVAVVDALAGALDEAAAGAELAGAAGAAAAVLLLALLHAAASSAAATGTPIFTGIGSRVSIELVMLVVSVLGRHNRRPTARGLRCAALFTCLSRGSYGDRAERDWSSARGSASTARGGLAALRHDTPGLFTADSSCRVHNEGLLARSSWPSATVETTVIKTSKPTCDGTVRITFALPADEPNGAVSVVGDFNDWNPFAHPLRRRANGTRSAVVTVPAGVTLRFRYLAEGGLWFDDETAHAQEGQDVTIAV